LLQSQYALVLSVMPDRSSVPMHRISTIML
jgi:hypothetical protein